MGEIAKLDERVSRWRLNSNKTRVSAPLGELRAALVRISELEEGLRQAAADFQDHAWHARRRIEDGDEMGSRVWRIALEDIAREAEENRDRATLLSKRGM